MIKFLTGLLCVLLLGGCVTQKRSGLDPSGVVTTSLGELPAPTAADGLPHSPAYTIGPFDELSVNIFGVEGSSGNFTADAQGRIEVPLAGSIDAGGLSPRELAERIAAKLRTYIKDPQVTVNVKELRSRTIAVDGQVRDPGVFPATNNLSLMRAVATAKGLSEDADVEDVVIFRTVSGQRLAAVYNLGAIRRGTYADPAIYPNDIIVVGDSPTTRLLRELAPVLASPIILLLQAIL